MPVMVLSIVILLAVTEVAAGVIRRYFPSRQGTLFSWILRGPAWLLAAWSIGVVLMSDTNVGPASTTSSPNTSSLASAIMTLTGLMMMSAFYGCVAGAGLAAMAINYARVPSGRMRAMKLLLLAVVSLGLGILPWVLAVCVR